MRRKRRTSNAFDAGASGSAGQIVSNASSLNACVNSIMVEVYIESKIRYVRERFGGCTSAAAAKRRRKS